MKGCDGGRRQQQMPSHLPSFRAEGRDVSRETSVRISESDIPDSEVGKREAVQERETLEDRCARIAATHQLSAREAEVLVYLAQGHTRASIAKRLFVSENTIREHVKNIYKKLYIHSRQQLIDMVDARR